MRNLSGNFAAEIAALVEDILRKHGVVGYAATEPCIAQENVSTAKRANNRTR